MLGGGRETKESNIDLSVGIILQKKRGDYVKKQDVLAIIHANDLDKLEEAKHRLIKAYEIQKDLVINEPVIKDIIKYV